jgi:hypothetical protein
MAGILDQQGIQNFYNTAITNDFARKNLFRVISLGGPNLSNDQLMYITSSTIPGRAITNVPVPFMGMSFNVPGTANYPNSQGWNVTFRMPADLSIRSLFENWTNYIFNDADSTGAYNIPDNTLNNAIQLSLLGKDGNSLRTYVLYGAYCQSVGELAVDLTSAGEVLEQQVTLAYQYWRVSDDDLNVNDQPFIGSLGTAGSLSPNGNGQQINQ